MLEQDTRYAVTEAQAQSLQPTIKLHPSGVSKSQLDISLFCGAGVDWTPRNKEKKTPEMCKS